MELGTVSDRSSCADPRSLDQLLEQMRAQAVADLR